MGKKKAFIEDRASAAHFHLVHRSQRDPLAATASQHVLTPAEISANLGRATSERAWRYARKHRRDELEKLSRESHMWKALASPVLASSPRLSYKPMPTAVPPYLYPSLMG